MGVKDSLIGRVLGASSGFSREQIAQTITLFLEHGIKQGASDIHIEPHDQLVWVRYRIHGALHGLHKLPIKALQPLLAQLRQKANLPDDNRPQEGSFTEMVSEQEITVHLAIMPVIHGERVVLHLSRATAAATDAASLGFWGQNLEYIHTALAQVHGLILVSGPKHSNRPATLYSLLELLRPAAISIGTIEETIEHRLPGVSQTKVTAHDATAYAGALHANLQQDMNAIMLTRLPTREIAETAVHAATTGHLLLAGTHADSAAAALLRLRHMGVESYMLAATLRLSIAQRTVKRLCVHCREQVVLSREQVTRLEALFDMTTVTNRKRVHTLEEQARRAGIGGNAPLSSTATHLTQMWQASAHGCEHCDHRGYHGSVELVEVLPGGEYLYKVLNDTATKADVEAAALDHDFIPLALDGLVKALRGETTITEVVHEAGALLN